MSQASGYTCDNCGAFATAKSNVGEKRVIPEGWMFLTVPANVNDRLSNAFDLCSNRCVRDFGAKRAKAEKELTDDKEASSNGNGYKKKGTLRALKMNHTRHHVNKDIVDPNCDLCVAITEPTNHHEPALVG